MKLTQLTVTKLPGINAPISIDALDKGVNFVTGPNASGKSSLIRALRYLLLPPAKDDPNDLILEAHFVQDTQAWRVNRIGSAQTWRCAGQPSERPNLPAGEALKCHLIRIEDLLSLNQGSDEQLAESIRIELDGGLNLRQLRAPLLEAEKATGRSEKRAFRETNERVNQITADHRALQKQRQALPELEQKIEDAKRSTRLCQKIELALDAIDHQDKIVEQQASLAALPKAIPALTGQELDQLNGLDKQRQILQKRLTETNQRINQNTQVLNDTGLSERSPSLPELEAMDDTAQALSELNREIKASEERLAITQGHLSQAKKRLNADAVSSAETAPELSVDSLNEVIGLARKIDHAHAQSLAGNDHRQLPRGLWMFPGIAAGMLGGLGVGFWLAWPALSISVGLAGLLAMIWLALRWSRVQKDSSGGVHTSETLKNLQAQATALANRTG